MRLCAEPHFKHAHHIDQCAFALDLTLTCTSHTRIDCGASRRISDASRKVSWTNKQFADGVLRASAPLQQPIGLGL
eukprot:1157659-Pelagomonas_calceolata.AAC.4